MCIFNYAFPPRQTTKYSLVNGDAQNLNLVCNQKVNIRNSRESRSFKTTHFRATFNKSKIYADS